MGSPRFFTMFLDFNVVEEDFHWPQLTHGSESLDRGHSHVSHSNS